ncbi:hypothetical protein B0J11DRAFT_591405 [Dendryphion nanum]|uniref:DUF676 domain-containing protein n=1 Tax=Dendryphion nanum TaxID=256645 RepID=A0A9P9IGX0_9PLEO|nr:hypothetical protein B0J11DRAFT_591405 [Dendryphion nanum]
MHRSLVLMQANPDTTSGSALCTTRERRDEQFTQSSESPVHGITVLNDCPDATVDICFIHGLYENRLSTWTANGQSSPWPKTLLAGRLDKTRILTFGYDAYAVSRSVASQNRLEDHAGHLLYGLTADRIVCNASSRPIIFIAHSIGGFVCKLAITLSRNSPYTYLQSIFEYTKGIIFMGTPHTKISEAWHNILAAGLGLKDFTKEPLMEVLHIRSELLQHVHNEFLLTTQEKREQGCPFWITNFFEELPTRAMGIVVPKLSATLQGYKTISIHANHSDMVKFGSAEDDGFKRLLGELVGWKKETSTALPDTLDTMNAEKRTRGSYKASSDHIHPNEESDVDVMENPANPPIDYLEVALKLLKIPESIRARVAVLQCLEILNLVDAAEFLPIFIQKESYSHNGKVSWQLSELADAFHSIISQEQSRGIEIMVDALDECDPDNLGSMIRRFDDSIKIARSAGVKLRVCWSDRHNPHFELKLANGPEILIDEQNHDDIRNYIEEKTAPWRVDGSLYSIGEELIRRANGNFLWAVLVCQNLIDAPDMRKPELEKRLGSTPSSLYYVFWDTLKHIEASEERLRDFICIAQCIFCCFRPLTIVELCAALSLRTGNNQMMLSRLDCSTENLEQFKKRVTDVSGGLFEVVTTMNFGASGKFAAEDTRVQTTHNTVRDFLGGKDAIELLRATSWDDFMTQGHKELTLTCFKALLSEEFDPIVPEPKSEGLKSINEIFESLILPRQPPKNKFLETYVQHFVFEHFGRASDYFSDKSPAPTALESVSMYNQVFQNFVRLSCSNITENDTFRLRFSDQLRKVCINAKSFGIDAEELSKLITFMNDLPASSSFLSSIAMFVDKGNESKRSQSQSTQATSTALRSITATNSITMIKTDDFTDTILIQANNAESAALRNRSSSNTSNHNAFDEDCTSVVSNDEEIRSQIGKKTKSRAQIYAVRLFGRIIAELIELRPLHEGALTRLGRHRFVRNYCRLLKHYVLKLQEDSDNRTRIQDITIRVLKSRQNRKDIARKIIQVLGPDDDDVTDHSSSDDSEQGRRFEENKKDVVQADDCDDFDSDLLAIVADANEFLCRNISMLDLELRLLVLPASLRETIESIPKADIHISHANDLSLINKIKAFIEDNTPIDWEWWPLKPRVPDLPPGRRRLEWQVSGFTYYQAISSAEAVMIQGIMDRIGKHPPKCYCCVATFHLSMVIKETFKSLLLWTVHQCKTSWPIQPPSTARLRYTPTATTTTKTTSAVAQNTPLTTFSGQPNANSHNATQRQSSGQNNPLRKPPPTSLWIIFGVKDLFDFHEIENIDMSAQLMNDAMFFKELKQLEKKYRWPLLRWFSPYIFTYCKFVQFETMNADRVFCCGESLPEDHGHGGHYEYHPRPPSATNPPIKRIEFERYLRTCGTFCLWAYMPILKHKCCRYHVDSHKWKKIPKKRVRFDPQAGDPGDVAYGIEAVYALSFTVVLSYHTLSILAWSGFWVYWLENHPNDLQNASVPTMVFLGVVASFWGVLMMNRK